MTDQNVFADKIEAIIMEIFSGLAERNFQGLEYAILYDPKKHKTWLIVFFFKDMMELKTALRDGTCYGMHQFLLAFFEQESKTERIEKLVSFQLGARPVTVIDNKDLFDKLTNKLQSLLDGSHDKSICAGCGHNFDNHELMCIREADETPFEGWIICPEENCTCFSTWSANYEGASGE